MTHVARRLIAALFLGALVLIPRHTAFAGQSVDPSALIPVPPSFYFCQADGANTICRGEQSFPDPSAPSGFLCGSSANPVDLIAQDIDTQDATRYYNAAGYLTRRVIQEDFQGTLTNPLNGAIADYTQKVTLTDMLATPGDLSTVTDTSTGLYRIYLPDGGTVFQSSGRVVIAPDGTETFASGGDHIDPYFQGDTALLQKLCTALGAPLTM